ncbi:MAG: hypothetical protein IPL39_25725 [Opitutaceae bacterium]|nr:hypothetical protein [Opitutaceae bacterium]
MAKYIDICREIDGTNRYMSNAIGMCRREIRAARGGERSRVDVFLMEFAQFTALWPT